MDKERRALLLARIERATEIPMLVLALAFLVTIALPEVMPLSLSSQLVLEGVAWIIWGVFALELVVKT